AGAGLQLRPDAMPGGGCSGALARPRAGRYPGRPRRGLRRRDQVSRLRSRGTVPHPAAGQDEHPVQRGGGFASWRRYRGQLRTPRRSGRDATDQIDTVDGRTLAQTLTDVVPATEAEIRARFTASAADALDAKRAAAIERFVDR